MSLSLHSCQPTLLNPQPEIRLPVTAFRVDIHSRFSLSASSQHSGSGCCASGMPGATGTHGRGGVRANGLLRKITERLEKVDFIFYVVRHTISVVNSYIFFAWFFRMKKNVEQMQCATCMVVSNQFGCIVSGMRRWLFFIFVEKIENNQRR